MSTPNPAGSHHTFRVDKGTLSLTKQRILAEYEAKKAEDATRNVTPVKKRTHSIHIKPHEHDEKQPHGHAAQTHGQNRHERHESKGEQIESANHDQISRLALAQDETARRESHLYRNKPYADPDVLAALNTEPSKRTDKDIKLLLNWITKELNNDFLLGLSRMVLKKLCSKMLLEKFPPRTLVFRQGDPSDKLYIILKGSVFVWVKGEEEEDFGDDLAHDKDLGKMVTTLAAHSEGKNTFGELGLLQKVERTASIETVKATDFLSIHSSDFQEVLANMFQADGKCDRLQQFSFFNRMRRSHVMVLALKCKRHIFLKDKVIVREGTELEHIMFITKGLVQVSKQQPENREVNLAKLSTGEMYGNIIPSSIVHPVDSKKVKKSNRVREEEEQDPACTAEFTLTAKSDVEILTLHKDELMKRVRTSTLAAMYHQLETQAQWHRKILADKQNSAVYSYISSILHPEPTTPRRYRTQTMNFHSNPHSTRPVRIPKEMRVRGVNPDPRSSSQDSLDELQASASHGMPMLASKKVMKRLVQMISGDSADSPSTDRTHHHYGRGGQHSSFRHTGQQLLGSSGHASPRRRPQKRLDTASRLHRSHDDSIAQKQSLSFLLDQNKASTLEMMRTRMGKQPSLGPSKYSNGFDRLASSYRVRSGVSVE